MTRYNLPLIGKLVLNQARRHPGRIALTVLAIIASACVVVWVVSGYDSLVEKMSAFREEYLGRYQLLVVPKQSEGRSRPGGRRNSALAQEVIDQLRQDARVEAIDSVFQTRILAKKLWEERGANPLKSDELPQLVATDAAAPPYALLEGSWIDQRNPALMEGAIDRGSALKLKVGLGDQLNVSMGRSEAPLAVRIIGIVDQVQSLPPMDLDPGMPSMRVSVLRNGPADAALYVPTAVAEKVLGRPTGISFAAVVLKRGQSAEEFRRQFGERYPALADHVDIQTVKEVGAELEKSSTPKSARAQAYTATAISMLAALFIIFTTLSMGVHERTREFAVLRSIALTKTQVAGMIVVESLLLGTIGWLGGLAAGWGMLKTVAALRPELLPGGASLGTWCIVLAGLCSLGGSLAAAIIPAWRVTSLRPIDAMTSRPALPAGRATWLFAICGLLLVAVNPLLAFYIPMPDSTRYSLAAIVGCSSAAVGFILLAPAVIALTEKYLGPLVARLLGLDARLLSTQLSANLSRTLGTTIAISLGLGLFVAMQIWGYSMLRPFLPGQWMPDALITLSPGVVDADAQAVSQIQGIKSDECLPLAVEQPRFASDPTGAKQRASVTRQDNCIMVGADPQRALGGDRSMFAFHYLEGTREDALKKLKQGRYCLVPDHFRRESGLGVGGKVTLVPPNASQRPVEYEIAGVVAMDGWHLMSKSGMRIRGARSAAMFFAPLDDVRRDFSIDRVRFFWANLDGQAGEEAIRGSLQALAEKNPPPAGSRREGRRSSAPQARIETAAALRETVGKRADSIIWALSKLPLVTLLVTSLGVANTVLSSVRARRWELGVLRALGVTRFGLVRLILAQAMLVGIAACILSFGVGVVTGYCGTEVSRYVDVHGGLVTPLVIPWLHVGAGFGLTLTLCLLAALGPAITTGRSEPLRLLQLGRMAG